MRASPKATELSPQNKFNTLVPVLITGEGHLIHHHHPHQRAAALSNAGHLSSRSGSQKPSGLLAKWSVKQVRDQESPSNTSMGANETREDRESSATPFSNKCILPRPSELVRRETTGAGTNRPTAEKTKLPSPIPVTAFRSWAAQVKFNTQGQPDPLTQTCELIGIRVSACAQLQDETKEAARHGKQPNAITRAPAHPVVFKPLQHSQEQDVYFPTHTHTHAPFPTSTSLSSQHQQG